KPQTGQASPPAPGAEFTYTSAVPVITGISPNVVANTGGTEVTITGIGFLGTQCPSGVKFGIIPAASCTVIDDTSIKAVAPPNQLGDTFVTVTTPNGTSEIANNFKYVKPGEVPPPDSGGGGDSGGGDPGGGMPPPTGQLIEYHLSYRWTLLTWSGGDDMKVVDAVEGADGQSLAEIIITIYYWDADSQAWKGWFKDGTAVPGANDFVTLERGRAYWVSISNPDGATWTVKDR
ncbi:MAG: IPT/TIG domain-containing protein, partial [Hyphomicrobiales bacterium]